MTMLISIFCYILATYGLSNLLVYGSGPFNILGEFRELCNKYCYQIGRMLDCMMCTSTNIGIILSCLDLLLHDINFTPFNLIFEPYDSTPIVYILTVLFDLSITSGCVWIIHTIQEMCEQKNENV